MEDLVHSRDAPAYGDAFLVGMLPLLVALLLAFALGRSGREDCWEGSSGDAVESS